jgi:hypothetical protein
LVLRGAATLGGEASDGLRRAVANLAILAETRDQQCSCLLLFMFRAESPIYQRYWTVPISKHLAGLVEFDETPLD